MSDIQTGELIPFPPQPLRCAIEQAIEVLIGLLDRCDGDPDTETIDDDSEPDDDREHDFREHELCDYGIDQSVLVMSYNPSERENA